MDFRVCPSCKQSVLDDDAKDCPFCGTSMSAKPSAGKPAPAAKPITSTKPTGKPPAAAAPIGAGSKSPASNAARPIGSKPSAATPPASPPTKPKSNDPFEFEGESLDKLFPVKARPGAGALYQVKCPMCEKVGFVPEKLIGKKVRCYNPDCLVPAYIVPEPPKVEVEVKPQKRSFLTPNIIILLVMLTAASGAGAGWYFFIRTPPAPEQDPFAAKKQAEVVIPKDTVKAGEGPKDLIPELTPPQQVETVLKKIEEVSYDEKGPRRTTIRQLAGRGYALAGDFAAAQRNVVKITELQQQLKFQEISPWISISWQALKENNTSVSEAAMNQAISISDLLPAYGFESNITAIEYSSRLAAAGQQQKAMQFLRKFTDTSLEGLLASWLMAIRANNTFDLWREWEWRPLLVDPFPQATAVSRSLVSRGMVDQALPWLDLLKSEETQMHSLAGMMLEAELMQDPAKKSQVQAKLMPLVEQRPKAEQAFIHSRVALVQHYMGRDETSLASYDKASALLKEIELPKSEAGDDMKGVYEGRSYSHEKTTLPAAGAYSNLARCCLVLKKRDQYDALVRQAVQMANLTMPSFSRIDSLYQNMEKSTPAVRQDLGRILNINNASDVNSAFTTYRKNLGQIYALSQRTREFEIAMLSQALLDEAQVLVRSILEENMRGDQSQVNLIDSRLTPALNAIAYVKNDESLKQFYATLSANRTFPLLDLVWTMELNLRPIMKGGKVATARELFATFSSDKRDQKLTRPETMMLACVYGSRLAGEKRIDDGFKWIDSIKDTNSREEAARLVTSLYSLIGDNQSKLIYDVSRMSTSPTEKANLLIGIAEGVTAKNPDLKLGTPSPQVSSTNR